MINIGAKIYFLIATGEVLVVTKEKQGTDIKRTTTEEDIHEYEQLKDKKVSEIDCIELDFGTLNSTFNNVKYCSVNLKIKQLERIYFTQEELNAMQQQNQEVQNLNSRVSDISTYLNNSDDTTISDVENSILEIEKNKIINGGM